VINKLHTIYCDRLRCKQSKLPFGISQLLCHNRQFIVNWVSPSSLPVFSLWHRELARMWWHELLWRAPQKFHQLYSGPNSGRGPSSQLPRQSIKTFPGQFQVPLCSHHLNIHNSRYITSTTETKKTIKTKLCGFIPQVNYTDRATAGFSAKLLPTFCW
jgi:hypothetical protein